MRRHYTYLSVLLDISVYFFLKKKREVIKKERITKYYQLITLYNSNITRMEILEIFIQSLEDPARISSRSYGLPQALQNKKYF